MDVCCDEKSRIMAMQKAIENAGYKPEIIVTNGWYGCESKTLRKGLGVRKIKHVVAHFERKIVFNKGMIYFLSNNRAEGLIPWLRNRYRKYGIEKVFLILL